MSPNHIRDIPTYLRTIQLDTLNLIPLMLSLTLLSPFIGNVFVVIQKAPM
jgi:hypothetical protein